MREITLEELLEAGCHFGHQVNRRNPKADEFIFEERSNIHIINLEKTHEGLIKAAEFLRDLASRDGYLVVVGTKRQARGLVLEEVQRARKEGAKGIFYVTSRWVGGTLTNFHEVSKNFKKLLNLRKFLESSEKENYTKREIVLFEKEKNKLEGFYGGIVDMDKIPDALYIIDTKLEDTAVKEAKALGVKTVGIVDTNSDPSVVSYPVPANDDAVGSIKIITSYLVDAWIEGSKSPKPSLEKTEEKKEKAEKAKSKVSEEKKTEKTENKKEEKTRPQKKPSSKKAETKSK